MKNMKPIVPEGESLRNAVKWISGHLKINPDIPLHKLIHEATLRFNLSPIECEQLIHFYGKDTARS